VYILQVRPGVEETRGVTFVLTVQYEVGDKGMAVSKKAL
jgi:hypothetical protein